MKKTIYSILIAATCLTAASCTETTKIDPEEIVTPAFLKLSSDKLVFDQDGGCSAVVISTNIEDWTAEIESEWYSFMKIDATTIEVTAPINKTPEAKKSELVVTGTKDGETLTQKVALVQRTDQSENLSENGTANCYIAKTETTYKFLATVKGNGDANADGNSKYIKSFGINIEDIAYADLLWETRPDGDRTMSREVIDGTPSYSNGYISFTTGRMEGNALIAVKDIKGTVLWSWHIWVLNDEIKVHDHKNTPTNVTGQIMDRNLGALNNEPMDIKNRGMFYQWGRKDPFLPSITEYVSDASDKEEFNQPNTELGNGTGAWTYLELAKPVFEAPGNISYTVEHPMIFLSHRYNSYDWYTNGESEEDLDSQLWADKKTIFDPCPVGYKVPGKDTWGIPAGNKSIYNGGKADEYDENGENAGYDWNIFEGAGRKWKYTGDFYPAAGNFVINTDFPNHHTGAYAFYYTTQTMVGANTKFRAEFTAYWAQYFSGAPVFSAQIRCVKE